MTNSNDNYFTRLSAINVSDYVEKKGQFNYLGWAYAVSQLRQCDPTATWEVKRFNGLPYLTTELGVFVEVAVTVQGITLSQIHPVLDAKNRPIPIPTTFDIDTSIQRCLVKAIALHGLGLSIYAGEDLPVLDSGDVTSVRLVTLSDPAGNSDKATATDTSRLPASHPATVSSLPKTTPPRSPTSPTPPRSDTITLAQVRYITTLIEQTGTELQKMLDYFGVERIEDIAKAEASRVIRSLEQQRDQRRAA